MSMHDRLVIAACALALSCGAALPESPDLGRIATPEEIAAWDISIGPDGAGLPAGRGTAAQGEAIFVAQCRRPMAWSGRPRGYVSLKPETGS